MNDPAGIAGRLGGRLGAQPLPLGQESTRAAPGPAIGPWWRDWLFVADAHWQLVGETELSRLSAGTRLLRLAVEEHVMFAEAASWSDGREEWAITGDCDSEDPVVVTRGTVPGELLEPAGSDPESEVFDVPVRALELLTGWRYDSINDELGTAVYVPIVGLQPAPAPAPYANAQFAVELPRRRPVTPPQGRDSLTVRWWRRLRGR
jgi:hypothetical protein